MLGAWGPPFRPAGTDNDRWHHLEVAVGPGGVAAHWDGTPLRLPADAAQKMLDEHAATMRPRFPGEPEVQQLRPAFTPGGGLGLYVWCGSASFRDVTVTALAEGR
jgi:serine/threonine-protein kinase